MAVLASGGGSPEKFTSPSLPEKPIRRNQGVIFIMPSNKNMEDDINSFEQAVNHRVQGLSFFADLDKKLPNPELIEKTFKSGRAVMINLQPRPTEDAMDLKDVFSNNAFVRGDHDETLTKVAKMMSQFGNKIIYNRLAFEMNGNWFAWSGDANGFVGMWRHVVNIFRENGASNVKWIFSPGYLPYPENIGDYYPGDTYVDVIGADIYNWEGLPPSFAINRINYYLKKSAPTKPLILGEIGASGYGRDEWLSEAVYKSLCQGASAINYFQIDKERDWRINSSEEVPNLRRIVDSGAFLYNEANLDAINQTILRVN